MASLAQGVPPWVTYAIAVASAAALAVDIFLLIQAVGPPAIPGIAATYLLGTLLLVLLATGARLGTVESMVLLLAAGIGVAALVGVAGGLPVTAVVALGYLFFVGAGYAVYRLDRRPSRELKAELPEAAQRQGVREALLMLKGTDIFQGMTGDQLRSIARLGRVERLHEGGTLGREGRPAEALYVILDGQIELSTQAAVGRTTVRMAGAGETVPLAALLGSGNLITTATAFNDARLFAIPRAGLLDLCAERPDIGMHLFRAASEILAERYRSMLRRHTGSLDRALLQQADLWANL